MTQKQENPSKDVIVDQKSGTSRRAALKKMALGAGVAAGAASLPDKWAKPIVDKVFVPAHAQTSTTTTVAPQPTTTEEPTTTPEPTTTLIEGFYTSTEGFAVYKPINATVFGETVTITTFDPIPIPDFSSKMTPNSFSRKDFYRLSAVVTWKGTPVEGTFELADKGSKCLDPLFIPSYRIISITDDSIQMELKIRQGGSFARARDLVSVPSPPDSPDLSSCFFWE